MDDDEEAIIADNDANDNSDDTEEWLTAEVEDGEDLAAVGDREEVSVADGRGRDDEVVERVAESELPLIIK